MVRRLKDKKKSGQERFVGLDSSLLEYWAWAHSDISSNAERGKLAEYLVARAVQDEAECRIEWEPYDVLSLEKIKIEVKASAYLQTWRQNRLSAIIFDIAPKREWVREKNQFAGELYRPAEVYVFCLFACKDSINSNPMDVNQWEFYVLNTKTLDEKVPVQKTIGLNSLKKLGAVQTDYSHLQETVRKEGQK